MFPRYIAVQTYVEAIECPILIGRPAVPVISPYGHIYDRDSIIQWLQNGTSTCPTTRNRLYKEEIAINRPLDTLFKHVDPHPPTDFNELTIDHLEQLMVKSKAVTQTWKLIHELPEMSLSMRVRSFMRNHFLFAAGWVLTKAAVGLYNPLTLQLTSSNRSCGYIINNSPFCYLPYTHPGSIFISLCAIPMPQAMHFFYLSTSGNFSTPISKKTAVDLFDQWNIASTAANKPNPLRAIGTYILETKCHINLAIALSVMAGILPIIATELLAVTTQNELSDCLSNIPTRRAQDYIPENSNRHEAYFLHTLTIAGDSQAAIGFSRLSRGFEILQIILMCIELAALASIKLNGGASRNHRV